MAQLELFGIPFKKTSKKEDLLRSLKAAYRTGKCDNLPASVEAIKTKLQQQYEAAVVVVKNKFFADIKDGLDYEVEADAHRFVAKYFLTTGLLGGTPDRTKTKTSLVFSSPSDWARRWLMEAIEAIPGLAIYESNYCVVLGWDTELDRAVQRQFDKLLSRPAGILAQANFDFDRFVRNYLHVDPAEDYKVTSVPSKRPTAAITFPGKNSARSFLHHDRLQELVDRTPGLCVKEVKFDRDTMSVVGWDAALVDSKVARVKEASARLKKTCRLAAEKEAAEEKARNDAAEAERQAVWERLLKPHRDLVAGKKSGSGPLTTEDLVGSYVVIWEGEEGKPWGDPYSPRYESRLDVFPAKSTHGVRASFYFGMVEGTMLLSTTRQSVELLREEQSKGKGKYCDQDYSDEEEEARRTGEKRQLGSVADPWGVEAARAKRQKPNPAARKQEVINIRAYFQFVCNTVDGYPEVDDDNSHIGHFDFDATKCSAKGQFILPVYFSEPQPLTLFKISDTPSDEHQPMEWYMFDGRRWGSW
ncbi:hypothetical protein QBC39DRAFT_332422 [Podospora conica]|nr:hypothetical protein QBC39DRAFT_332422 [Schizothecium conicum]